MHRAVSIALIAIFVFPLAARAADDGFQPIFDGKSLEGWDGDPKFWRVEDGVIVGETTEANPTTTNTFLIWRGGEPGDFEIKAEWRLRNHNSGVQVRSWEEPENWGKWVVGGYQGDIEETGKFPGIIYGEKFRGILALRGQKTEILPGQGKNKKKPEIKVVGSFGEPEELLKKIDLKGWNKTHIIAKGYVITQKINGTTMSEVIDNDTDARRSKGLVALQLHQGPPMKVEFRNVRIKMLDGANSGEIKPAATDSSRVSPATGNTAPKKIVVIAGGPSHGLGAHDHYPGCVLLSRWLEKGLPGVKAPVFKGWPAEPSAFDGAAAIVIFADGGGKNLILPHMEQLEALMKQGVGLAMLHYAVDVPAAAAGPQMLEWIGGYYESGWSVNPLWTAEVASLPQHPITRGVRPFSLEDEWYYHMRFREGMDGVKPILTAIPPDESRERKNSNDVVRSRRGQPEHLAWARERPDGGRGFGFTGGHWHHNWAHKDFRTLVLNAIAWVAKIDVPPQGVPSAAPTMSELDANQEDEPAPRRYDREKIVQLVEQWTKQ
ncbi:MAG: family 16 glycoside hydrolase [Planctomycetota bacterium]